MATQKGQEHYKNVHNSFIYNNAKLETIWISIKRRVDKQNEKYSYMEYHLTLKRVSQWYIHQLGYIFKAVYWGKEFIHKSVHTIWSYLSEVQEPAKWIYDVGNWNNVWFWAQGKWINYKRAGGNFLGWWKSSI